MAEIFYNNNFKNEDTFRALKVTWFLKKKFLSQNMTHRFKTFVGVYSTIVIRKKLLQNYFLCFFLFDLILIFN